MQKNTETNAKRGVPTQKVVILGLMLALEIVFSRFLSISTELLKISFGFVPIVLVAILYGPMWAGVIGGFADLIGALLFPIGPYFPGFTASALITGIIFGLFLYRQPLSWWRALLAALAVAVIVSLGLDVLWLVLLYNKGVWVVMSARLIKCAVMVPLQTVVIPAIALLSRRVIAK